MHAFSNRYLPAEYNVKNGIWNYLGSKVHYDLGQNN